MVCCGCIPLAEDNARFFLLAVVLVCYMLMGALIFQHLESDVEVKQSREYWKVYSEFRTHYLRMNGTDEESLDKLHKLLYAYGNATALGVIHRRRRWDFAGSFHFAGTIVSTIGYGNTTPQTTAGRAAVIMYGFFGCSGGILFFNLFLERIITFLAWILRTLHLRRLKKRMKESTMSTRRVSKISRASLPDILDDDDDTSLENWKPSVYWVMFSLSLASCTVASIAAAVYAPFENWSYFEAIYFCFVSFATIGFGDYVATQAEYYPNVHFYRVGNFIFLSLGCCCIYSLLNVTSIVIKQGLNWFILKLQCRWKDDPMSATGKFWRRHSLLFQNSKRNRRRRSSAAIPHNARRIRRSGLINSIRRKSSHVDNVKKDAEADSESIGYDSDGGRRNSGEMISMKDFLKSNKVSLAVMQKQLYETAQMQRDDSVYVVASSLNAANSRRPVSSFTPGTVGPLAIVSEKLGDNAPAR